MAGAGPTAGQTGQLAAQEPPQHPGRAQGRHSCQGCMGGNEQEVSTPTLPCSPVTGLVLEWGWELQPRVRGELKGNSLNH